MALTGVFDRELANDSWFDVTAVPIEWFDDLEGAQYTLTAVTAAFTFTGNQAGLIKPPILVPAVGVFTETGVAANLLRGRRLITTVGTFVEAGQSDNLIEAHRLSVTVGAFTETGVAIAFRYLHVNLTVGTFAMTGVAASFAVAHKLTATVGTFAETGNAAGLTATHRLITTVGTFTEVGQLALFQRIRTMVAALANFNEAGQAANLLSNHRLIDTVGTFLATGQAANLLRGRRVVGVVGAFVAAAQAANLLAKHRLVTTVGTFGLTGQAVGFIAPVHSLQAAVRTFALTGVAAAMRRDRTLEALPAEFLYTGTTINLGFPGNPPFHLTITAERSGFGTLTSDMLRCQVGDAPTIRMTFADSVGDKDPTDFTLYYQHFNTTGVSDTALTKVKSQCVRTGVGAYYYTLPAFGTSDIGRWYLWTIATGDVQEGTRKITIQVRA